MWSFSTRVRRTPSLRRCCPSPVRQQRRRLSHFIHHQHLPQKATPNMSFSLPPSSPSTPAAPLPLQEVSLVSKHAQLRGAISAVFAGMVTGLLCQRLLRYPSKYVLANSLLAGGAAGYISARAELKDGLAELEKSTALRKGGQVHTSSTAYRSPGTVPSAWHDDNKTRQELRAANEAEFEAGVGGMHEFVDRYATTRGDH